MPRQSQLPHTAAPPGPCDRELEAWLDAKEVAKDATGDRNRKYTELLDAALAANIMRIPFVDPVTNKRKWLYVRSTTKLVAVKPDAEQLEQEDTEPAPKHTTVRTPKTGASVDPFGDTRADMAVEGSELHQDESGAEDRTGGPVNGNAATGQLVQESNSGTTGDLRTAGQQRRRGAR